MFIIIWNDLEWWEIGCVENVFWMFFLIFIGLGKNVYFFVIIFLIFDFLNIVGVIYIGWKVVFFVLINVWKDLNFICLYKVSLCVVVEMSVNLYLFRSK